ncbi:MAG: hypothetical protein RML72_08170, partial [Bacteroidia bacterium]|nr:hypothetical protein [Bacteroidia bacterium]
DKPDEILGNSRTDLGAGNLQYELIDATGCEARDQKTVRERPKIEGFEFPPLCANCPTPNLCGSIQITKINHGRPPFRFLWSTGDTTPSIKNLKGGRYELTITDSVGCQIKKSWTLTEPEPITLRAEFVDPIPIPSSPVRLIGAGGQPNIFDNCPLPYNSAHAFPAEQNIPPNFEPCKPIWYSLPGGENRFWISDLFGCIATTTIQIPSDICNSFRSSVKPISCKGANDAQIEIQTHPDIVNSFTYQWSTGARTPVIRALSPGTYSVTINIRGCPSQTLTFKIEEPLAPNFSIHALNEKGDNIVLRAQGGKPPYQYGWNNVWYTDSIFFNVSPGNHVFAVKDACGSITQINHRVIYRNCVKVNATIQGPGCPGNNQGSMYIQASGGLPPYQFRWSNGATTRDIFNLPPGNYTLTLTDGNGCVTEKTFEIIAPLGMQLIPSVQNAYTQNDGAIEWRISGGIPPFEFSFGGQVKITTERNGKIENLAPGTYSIQVRDAANCMLSVTVTVGQLPASQCCEPPSNFTIEDIGTDFVLVSFKRKPCGQKQIIRARYCIAGVDCLRNPQQRVIVQLDRSPIRITSLQRGTRYQIILESLCDEIISAPSPVYFFETLP